jgi:hypothetical protein
MKSPVSRQIVEATASLLSEEPKLSNAELIRRLTARLGEEEMRSILVTRFQRQVRDPAVRLLHARTRNGASAAPPPEEADPAERRGATADPFSAAAWRRIDAALLRAFRLGAEADSPGEIVEAFRRLDGLRAEARGWGRNGRAAAANRPRTIPEPGRAPAEDA